MDFEKVYPELLKYAKIVSLSHPEIEPGDLVNDAYIKLYSNKNATFVDYKRVIYGGLKRVTIYEKQETHSTRDIERVCNKCHVLKPITDFRLIAHGKLQIKNDAVETCRLCEIKRVAEYQKKNPQVRDRYEAKSENKKKNAERVKKFVKNNRDEWNAYQRERYKLFGRKDRVKCITP